MIKLDLQSRVPLYEQLQEQIIRLSLLGVLEENEQLPSVRSLAREVGVNPNTVAKAYQELERQGIIYTVSGRGSFVSPNVLSLQSPRQAALDEVFEALDKALSRGIAPEEVLEQVKLHLNNHHKEQIAQMVSRYKLKLVMLIREMKQKKCHLKVMEREVLQMEVVQSQEKVIQGKTQLHKILVIRKMENNQGELEEAIINKQKMKLYLN